MAMFKPIPMDPELTRLIEASRKLPPMTAAQLREQRISFAYGNCSIDNPRITKAMVEKIHDEMYGKPNDNRAIVSDPQSAAAIAELQRAQSNISRALDYLMEPKTVTITRPGQSPPGIRPLPSVRTAHKWPWQRDFWR